MKIKLKTLGSVRLATPLSIYAPLFYESTWHAWYTALTAVVRMTAFVFHINISIFFLFFFLLISSRFFQLESLDFIIPSCCRLFGLGFYLFRARMVVVCMF